MMTPSMGEPIIRDAFDRGDCVLTFGDNVIVRTTHASENAAIAGAQAQVMGETTPSVTGVSVIGNPKRDYAIALSIKSSGKNVWIDPELVEFADHGAGTTFSLKGIPKGWTRTADGKWQESKLGIITRIRRWFQRK
jgi:hypothetical protein